MDNPRFKKYFSSLVDKGWSATGHNGDVVDENFAQFFTYFPHNDHLVMASMSVDRFYQLHADAKTTVPAHLLERDKLAELILQASYATHGAKKPEIEEQWAIASALYMPTTSTGNTVVTQFYGRPFAFFTVMYPSNKAKTDFGIRPASVVPLEQILSVDETRDYFNQIIASDKQSGKKQYFKYLKR
ncbi:hypothetical protein [Alteromonas macleodii]|uniref:hypothetical protein n=1 Tax=Alteromonas macleodii TaxID=28108 RepID=UPI00313FF90D